MIVFRVLFILLLASAGTRGQAPQWQRQSTLPNVSSPLAMGMRFLENIRTGMTRTFQGIFGGNQQSKEVHQGRPIRQQILPPPEPAPVSPVHDIGFGAPAATEPPTSFFTVLHELDSSTAFPDTRGFTDESFKPSEFFTGNSPFQGKVEEELLPFHQDVTGGVHQSPPVSAGNIHGGVSGPQPPPRSSFNAEDARQDSPIPFGNTHTFNLGAKQTQHALPPANHFSETPDIRETLNEPLPGQLLPFPLPHSILANRADYTKTNSPQLSPPQPKTLGHQTTQSVITNPSAQKPSFAHSYETTSYAPPAFVGQNRALRPTISGRFLEKNKAPQTSFQANTNVPSFQGNFRAASFLDNTKAPFAPQAKEVKSQKELSGKANVNGNSPGGLINTGIKMRLAPATNNQDGEGAEVSSYEFGYGVLDRNTGNQFFHAEKREEGLTKGSYKIQLPDGRVQTVTYLADKQGFRPKITYEGKAKYPANKEDKTAES